LLGDSLLAHGVYDVATADSRSSMLPGPSPIFIGAVSEMLHDAASRYLPGHHPHDFRKTNRGVRRI